MCAEVFGCALPVRQRHAPVNLIWQITYCSISSTRKEKDDKRAKVRDTNIQQLSARELNTREDGPSATREQRPAAAPKSDAKANKWETFSTSVWHTGVKTGPRQLFPAPSPVPSSAAAPAYTRRNIAWWHLSSRLPPLWHLSSRTDIPPAA